jgi:hypothetical protein
MPFHWPNLSKTAQTLARLYLAGVFAASAASAQAPEAHHFVASSSENTRNGTTYRSAIQKKTRFLGWNFAARYGSSTAPNQQRGSSLETASPGEINGAMGTRRTADGRPALTANGTTFANPGFVEHPSLPTGFIPTAIVQGDFNGDGHMDVAISNGGDNTVYVLLGKGDGTFQVPEILYTQGLAPTWIAAVSLRNNGHLDLAVTEGDSKTVEIFLGNGDGTFQQGVQTALPQTPTFVLSGDFNNDGHADLAIGLTIDAGEIEPQFEILLGDGTGGFKGSLIPPPKTGASDPVPTGWMSVGDVNNDGFLDVVTTVTGGYAATYLNQGGTSFTHTATFGPTDSAMAVELGDMDEDGCLDAVETGSFGFLTIAKGTCDGNFTQGDPIAVVGDIDPAIKVVDVNGDGHLDVVASAAYYGLGNPGQGAEAGYLVSVLKGDGHGNVAPAQIYRGGLDIYSLVVTDLKGDGKPEIIALNSGENNARIFLNDGPGNFGGPQGESIGYLSGTINSPDNLTTTQAVDLNGDGKPDLCLIEVGEYGSIATQMTVMLNDGTGKFLPPLRSPLSVGLTSLDYAAAVFRTGRKPDVVYVSVYQAPFLAVFLPGNGDGTFGAPVTLATLPNPEKIVVGDFNHDGKLDFAAYGTDNGVQLELDVFLGQGDGTFRQLPSQTFANPSSGTPFQIFALDLNQDGKLDILVGNSLNGGWTNRGDDLVEMLGNGDGTFQAAKILIPHFGTVTVADVNGDGIPDLIQNRDPNENVGASPYGTPGVTVYLGTAQGTFVAQPTYSWSGVVEQFSKPVLVGDFNGDGIPDMAYEYSSNFLLTEPSLRILQGVGDGTFILTAQIYQLPGYSNPFVGADFDGDGTTDLVELTGYTSSFHTIPGGAAPALSIALNSNPLIGTSGSATVTLDVPATATETVVLAASDPAVQLPGALHFAVGEQSHDFSFTLGTGFDGTHALQFSATLGSQTAVAYASKPNPNVTVGVNASLGSVTNPIVTATITPAETLQITLGIRSVGGYSGRFSSFACNGLPAGASCAFGDASLSVSPIGAGQTSITLTTSSTTPQGSYPIRIAGTDGHFSILVPMELAIGDFALTLKPSMIVLGPSGSSNTTVTFTSTNGLNEQVQLTCSGLPATAQCTTQGFGVNTNGGMTALTIGGGPIAPKDYPLQITGATAADSHSVAAVLRVGDYTATIDKTSATLTAGQSATFTVSLSSINHYTSTISISCQSPTNSVTCTVSPPDAALSDGGTTTATLVISANSGAAAWRAPTGRMPSPANYAWLLGLPIAFLVRRKRKALVLVFASVLIAAISVSCGGGGSSVSLPPSSPSSPSPPPPPTPSAKSVQIPVTASASSTASDLSNQKTAGTITITLQ